MTSSIQLAVARREWLPLRPAGLEHLVSQSAPDGLFADGVIVRDPNDREGVSLPLGIVLHKRQSGDLGIARYEIPYLLLMANMAFHHNEALGMYEAFMISVEKSYKYTLIKATVSSKYLKSIRQYRQACGTLKVLRTKSFEIFDVEVRMEFLRCVMAFRGTRFVVIIVPRFCHAWVYVKV
ncbi:hypothetical protein BJY01DRAFT_247697 [Aspergillus pseudoustus]|uniref:Uncharacterized protein n=1 Tax=Aspergillus pseudoustus TaxID=1810923 RepID=A0ABR4JZC5_9EURO